MAKNSNMAFFVAMAAAALVMNSVAAANTYQVGDGLGWTLPTNNSFYTTWASNKMFAVGDILVFNFPSGQHDVATVTKAAYDSCSTTSPISLATSGPARISLNSSGDHYFICTVGGHCGAGQKLTVSVTGASSPAPTPSTTTTPPPSPSPPVAVPAPAPSTTTPTPPSSGATPPSSSGSPSTPTTPSSPTPDATSPPPPNAATSLGVAGLSTTFLSIALALLF